MEGNISSKNNGISVIGVIPKYPKHSQNNIYSGVRMPPVGIISILSQIKKDSRLKKVYGVDENNYGGPRDIRDYPDHSYLQEKEPASIAMFYGGMSNSIPRLFALARWYKGHGTITIAGGSHVDALPEEALRSGIDIVVHGEGEEIVKEIVDKTIIDNKIVFDSKSLFGIKGISFLDEKGEYVFTGKRESRLDLDKLEDTDLNLIKYMEKRWSAIPINKGRGCNYNCEFCVVNKQYGRYKSCSVEKALNQVIKYSKEGYKSFFFVDDNFAQDVDETIRLCKEIGNYKRKFRKKIKLMVQVRNEVAENPELIEAMKFAGVDTLAIGYESPIDEELKAMKKGVTVEKLAERSRKLSVHFYIHGMFIFGYPTFSDSNNKSVLSLEEKAKEYIRFFKRSKIDTIQIMNAVPLPGSELRDKLDKENRLLPLEIVGWDKYDGLFLCYDPTPEGIDPYDLLMLPKIMMKKQYLGDVLSRRLNYGNWINWTYYSTIGFPIQMGIFYVKRFFHNFWKKKRQKNLADENISHNIFLDSFMSAWKDVKRRWRNLAIKTYAGITVKRWLKEYKKGDYMEKYKQIFTSTKKQNI